MIKFDVAISAMRIDELVECLYDNDNADYKEIIAIGLERFGEDFVEAVDKEKLATFRLQAFQEAVRDNRRYLYTFI